MAIGNSVNDEIREQHDKMKDKTFKEKLSYFWEYYKVHTIVAIIAAICAGQFIYSIATRKETVLEVAFVNTFPSEEVDIAQHELDITNALGYDPDKYQVILNANMFISYEKIDEFSGANVQKLMAMAASNALNVILTDDTYLEHSYEASMFGDLSEMLPPDVLAKYEDKLLYKDLPDDDKGEVPIAINVSESKFWLSQEIHSWFTLLPNSTKIDDSVKLLDFLMEQ